MANEPVAGDRACDRCRERRVKCDKQQPTCLRCEKLGKPCPGYDKKRKFVDEGVSLRRKYQGGSSSHDLEGEPSNPSQNNAFDPFINSGPSSIKGDFLSPSNHSGSPQTVNSVKHETVSSFSNRGPSNPPDHATSQPTSAPATNQIDPMLFPDSSTHQLDEFKPEPGFDSASGLNDIFSDPTLDPAWFDLQPSVFFGSAGNSCGFIPNIPNIIDEVDRNDLMQGVEQSSATPKSAGGSLYESTNNLWGPESQLTTSAIITDEREHEMAYLIRHFTEALGPWMDLFDRDKHFGHLVPLKALRDALLRNAIAAVAAKQLGRVKGSKSYIGVQFQKPAVMEVMDNIPELDWFYKAANYYDKAIAFSRMYLQAITGSFSTPPSPDAHANASMANSDDLLVAVSIFSLYESLDNLEVGWLQHLSGMKTLMEAVTAEQQTQKQIIPAITVGRRASLWNFARADYQAAYLNHQHTFLDTNDYALWRSCGLQIHPDGTLYNVPFDIKQEPVHCRQIAELVAHTLLWLVLRVMNHLASADTDPPQVRQDRWATLIAQLDAWQANVPETFQPCAQVRYPLSTLNNTHNTSRVHRASPLTEVFFSIDVCAAALQLYHFARILLLLNQPPAPPYLPSSNLHTKASAAQSRRAVPPDAVAHARQICGIALGRPHPAVRVEMLLPLTVAGSCFELEEERRVVLELLGAIEMDTGCATEARRRELMRGWGWEAGSV